MNILGRHCRHQLTVLACCHAVMLSCCLKSPALKLQYALSFLRIFEATCSLKELIKISLTFQGNKKAAWTVNTRPTNCEGSKNSWNRCGNRCHWQNTNTESKHLKPRWPRYPLRCTAANHSKYFLCKLPRCSLFEVCRETLRFCWKSWKTTSWPQPHGSFEREGINATCHLRVMWYHHARPRNTKHSNRVYAAFYLWLFVCFRFLRKERMIT